MTTTHEQAQGTKKPAGGSPGKTSESSISHRLQDALTEMQLTHQRLQTDYCSLVGKSYDDYKRSFEELNTKVTGAANEAWNLYKDILSDAKAEQNKKSDAYSAYLDTLNKARNELQQSVQETADVYKKAQKEQYDKSLEDYRNAVGKYLKTVREILSAIDNTAVDAKDLHLIAQALSVGASYLESTKTRS